MPSPSTRNLNLAELADLPQCRPSALNVSDSFVWCLHQHEDKHGSLPAAGGRNNWLAAFALFCNERGVERLEFESEALTRWQADDFDAPEIRQVIRGIYERHATAHGTKQWSGTPTTHQPSAHLSHVPVLETPLIPAEVYDALPVFLKQCCQAFPTERERDVMLIGTLGVLSGCFPCLYGYYDGARVGINLFVFIVAPAASGKGAMAWARRLAYPYHKRLIEASNRAKEEYNLALDVHQQAKRQHKGSAPPTAPPPAPYFKQLYLPANTSAAMLVKALSENEGRGVIAETEADTLSSALGQDWGNFSDLLRKAFHHEPYSSQRKSAGEYYEIEMPALSVVLSGTPDQVKRLIPSAEDGLFSRFLFYVFQAPHQWRDVSPEGGRENLDDRFKGLSANVTRMMDASQQPLCIDLTTAQWKRLNQTHEEWLDGAIRVAGEDAGSVSKRLGLISFRFMLLLTQLRIFELGLDPAGHHFCAEIDFETAISLTRVLRSHALAQLARMPTSSAIRRQEPKENLKVRAQQLSQSGHSVRAISDLLGVGKSTVADWIKNQTSGKVRRPDSDTGHSRTSIPV